MMPGFDIHTELAGTRGFRLFRGRRQRDGKSVLLKVATDGDAQALQRELEITRSVGGASVLNALEIVEHGATHALVLEDPGGLPLGATLAGRTESIADSL